MNELNMVVRFWCCRQKCEKLVQEEVARAYHHCSMGQVTKQ